MITDRDRYTDWQTQLVRVETLDETSWIEYPKTAPEPLRFYISKDDRPRAMEIEYSMGDTMQGRWRGEITPTEKGVTLRTTDSYKTDGFMTKLLMGAFFDLDGFAKDWNSKLKRRVETLEK